MFTINEVVRDVGGFFLFLPIGRIFFVVITKVQ